MRPSNLLLPPARRQRGRQGRRRAAHHRGPQRLSARPSRFAPATTPRVSRYSWGVHCVNEEPGGRVVDYAQGLVFDDRRQLVAALFDNARVVVEQEDLDW